MITSKIENKRWKVKKRRRNDRSGCNTSTTTITSNTNNSQGLSSAVLSLHGCWPRNAADAVSFLYISPTLWIGSK